MVVILETTECTRKVTTHVAEPVHEDFVVDRVWTTGRRFVSEHQASHSPWKHQCLRRLADFSGIYAVEVDIRGSGQMVVRSDGVTGLFQEDSEDQHEV